MSYLMGLRTVDWYHMCDWGLNVKVDYLIIHHRTHACTIKGGVPWAEAIPVNFCEIRKSIKKLGTLKCKFRTTFVTKYSSRSLILESHFTIPPCLFKFNTMFMPIYPAFTFKSTMLQRIHTISFKIHNDVLLHHDHNCPIIIMNESHHDYCGV